MSELNINQRENFGITILDLEGKIALGETNQKLHQTIRELLDEGRKSILLNLSGVTLIDSSGLGEMVAGHASAQRHGATMKLCSLSERFIELMTVTKLYTVFDVFESETSAIESFVS